MRDYLRSHGCLAFVNDSRSLEVYPEQTTNADDERTQIRIWIAVWNKLNPSKAGLLD